MPTTNTNQNNPNQPFNTNNNPNPAFNGTNPFNYGSTNANQGIYGNPSTSISATPPTTMGVQQSQLYNTLGGNFGQALPSFLMQSGYSPYATGNPMVKAMTNMAPQMDAMSQFLQIQNPEMLTNPAAANQQVYNQAITGNMGSMFSSQGGYDAYQWLRDMAKAGQADPATGLPSNMSPTASAALSMLSGQNAPQLISNLLYGNVAGNSGNFLRDWMQNTLPSYSNYAFEHPGQYPTLNTGPSAINYLDILNSISPQSTYQFPAGW